MRYNSMPILNTETGVVYECIKDVISEFGYGRSYIYDRLRGRVKNNTSFIKI